MIITYHIIYKTKSYMYACLKNYTHLYINYTTTTFLFVSFKFSFIKIQIYKLYISLLTKSDVITHICIAKVVNVLFL